MNGNSQLERKEQRRIFIILLVLTLLLIFIIGKLFWIQVAASRNYSHHNIDLVRNSVLQRQRGLVLDSGRGDFYDRNLQPITGQRIQVLIVFPVRGEFRGSSEQITKLARILNTSKETWNIFVGQLKEPRLWSLPSEHEPIALSSEQVEQVKSLRLPHVLVTDYKIRYPVESAAKQLIGFIGQNPQRIAGSFPVELEKGQLSLTSEIGGAGLEKTYEPWLQGIGSTSISYFTDGAKRPLRGLDARMIAPTNGYYPLKVVTTLNLTLQKQIEELMEQLQIHEGSAVVLGAAQADVVAMASRPTFDPAHVDLEKGNWSNLAVKSIAPGSIFKTVVAAAALEEGVVQPGETFDCEGALGKYGFTCWKKGGHGRITLEEAYAESCNIVFAKVMQRISSDQLETYAKKMGLLTKVGWSGSVGDKKQVQQFDAEEGGQLFAAQTPKEDEGVRIQTAIGQRDVLVSPLQAANLVVTLLHGGKVLAPRVVKEVRFQNDHVMDDFPEKILIRQNEGISSKTSKTILHWMEEVVTDGTGKGLLKAKWKLAGKSGTAEVGAEKQSVNQWFIGYGPVSSPKYAVSVVIENASAQDDNKSIALFKGIMDILARNSAQD